jgi:Sulfotransferase family
MAIQADAPTRAVSPRSDAQKPKVIYVMGRGKSGSTILGVTLGNCSDIFFAGELCTWLMTSGKPVLRDSNRTQFWNDVCSDVNAGAELFGTEACDNLERGLSAFRVDRWRARRRLRERYRRVTEALYASIANRAGVTHVVDTSHLPMRARELQGMAGIDLYIVFLVRDVEGVVASYMRKAKRAGAAERGRRFLTINARLWAGYLLAVLVFLRHPRNRRLLVRHEDFIANPEAILREILAFTDSSSEIPDLSSLDTGMPLRGNKLLKSEVVALKAEAAPPQRPSRLMRLAQRPWSLVLARLRPAATGATSREHAGALDAS